MSTHCHLAKLARRVPVGLTLALALVAAPARGQESTLREAPAGALRRNAHVVVPQSGGFPLDRRVNRVQVEAVRVHVVLREAAARTTLDLTVRNTGSADAESVLLVPVPTGAAVGAFDFQGGGAEPTATMLLAAEARRIYDDIVRRARDPALLEFAGRDLLRSSVFPVPAGGIQRVRVSWESVADVDGARIDYVLPRSGALEGRTPWEITVDVRTAGGAAAIYSPSHQIEIERDGDERARVRVATAAQSEPGDFRLSVVRAGGGVGGSLFAYPDPASGGGTFLFLAGVPKPEGAAAPKRQVVLALDRSGSMAGPKMDQARAAALQVIEGLADGERFNVIDYGTTVARFAVEPVEKTRESTLEVREYLAALRPGGGTNLHDALVESLRQPAPDDALPLVLFLTDGLPTVGQRSEAAIASVVDAHAALSGRALPRLFSFGVGNDVNAPLLDRMADKTRAVATYVAENADVELAVDRVFRRLAGPVLAATRLVALDEAGEVSTRRVHDVIPSALPDVFDGDGVVVLGRYRGTGPLRLRLSGLQGENERSFNFQFDLSRASTTHDFVPRLWATRRIAYLTDEVRQAAAEAGAGAPDRTAELTEEIVRLSTEHGVLTEYTAFLAREGTDLSGWDGLVAACSAELDRQAVRTRSGVSAVAQAVNFNDRKWQAGLNGSNRMLDENQVVVSYTAVRQAADRSFFRRGTVWLDGGLAGDAATTPDRTVTYGSDAHLALLHRLALTNRQAVLSLRGDILLRVEGEIVLVKNPEDC